jgi:hypothetical protein
MNFFRTLLDREACDGEVAETSNLGITVRPCYLSMRIGCITAGKIFGIQ